MAETVSPGGHGGSSSGGGGGGTQIVDVQKFGGVAINQGQDVAANSIPVVLASDAGIVISGSVTAAFVPATSGGLTLKSNIIPGNTTAIVVKSSAGQVYKVEAFSIGTSVPAVIHWYNATSATAGSGTPVWRTIIPAPPAGAGGYVSETLHGLAFSTGITYVVTASASAATAILDTDTTAPTANLYVVNIGYA